MSPSHSGGKPAGRAGRFATTHWSLVLDACDGASPKGDEALVASLESSAEKLRPGT